MAAHEPAPTTATRRVWRMRVALVAVAAIVVLLAAELGTWAISPHLYPPDWAAGEVAFKNGQLHTIAAGDHAIDVVFLGDSMIDAGIDPERFTAVAPEVGPGYNAALLGAPLSAQALWADRLVLPTLTPDLVILGVSPTSVSTLGMGTRERLTYGEVISDNVRSLDDDRWSQMTDQAGSLIHLVRYRASLRNPRLVAAATWQTVTGQEGRLDASVRPPEFWPDNVAATGQVRSYGDGRAAPTGPAGLIDNIQTMLASDQVMAPLDDLVSTLRSRGASVVIVVPPTALDVMAASGVDVGRWQAAVDQITAEAQRLDVAAVDFTDDGYGRALFFDPFHLNQAGSERFTTELATTVARLCRSDHRVHCAR